MKKKLKIFLGIDLQAWDIHYICPIWLLPNINIHTNIDYHLKT